MGASEAAASRGLRWGRQRIPGCGVRQRATGAGPASGDAQGDFDATDAPG